MRPSILVTNDDGIIAPGIKALVEIASRYGDVVVVAPNSPQSGMGHALTISKPIRLSRVDIFGDIEAYECSGTPVDCVKLAKHVVFKDRTIDLCVSGVNHGSNASINILYSGTVSAAMEASIEGINSIGFSLEDYSHDADFGPGMIYVDAIIRSVLENGLSGCKLLNVNIPKASKEELKGIKVCTQAQANWKESFHEAEDPRGEKYYWLTGEFVITDDRPTTDLNALQQGYVSVVPSMHDLTSHNALDPMKFLEQ